MTARALMMWSEELLSYNFGAHHPMAPARLTLTYELMTALGITDVMTVAAVPLATDAELSRVHDPDYLTAVQQASDGDVLPGFGLGNEDTRPRRASGFCVYNDIAVAIADLLVHGAARIAYVDVDAHGDGVERAFWNDDRVLAISIHQHPDTLFPGTGYVQDLGGPLARGYSVNIPVPADTTDNQWLRAIVAPLLAEFAPELLITQHGCDTHPADPLVQLAISVDAQRAVAALMGAYAEEDAGGRWVATGGGGYDIADVVPRTWSHVDGCVAGAPIDVATPTPPSWRELAARQGKPATTMGDGAQPRLRPWTDGFDPADDIDRTIMSVRRSVFPWHGLDSLPH